MIISGTKIISGMVKSIDIPIPGTFTHKEWQMPVHISAGRKLAGPKLFVSAAVHGDEINGVEIIRRLLASNLVNEVQKGVLLLVPVVNSYGFIARSRYLPDRRDLNRSFPGNSSGSQAARLAHIFSREILNRSDYGIDLHSAAIYRSNFPQIRTDLSKKEQLLLARSFGAPVILDAKLIDGSMRSHAHKKGVAILVYEGGEALRLNEEAITFGLAGIARIMEHLGMISHETLLQFLCNNNLNVETIESRVLKSSAWVRATKSGIMHSNITIGSLVKNGELLATIGDPFDKSETKLFSPCDAFVVGQIQTPLINEGDALFHLASDSLSHNKLSAPDNLEN